MTHVLVAAALVALAACSAPDAAARDDSSLEAPAAAGSDTAAAIALETTLERATALADSIDDALLPVPLLRPGEEAALRQYSSAENLARARRLGRRVESDAHIERLLEEGRLVRLEDSTRYWVLRDLRSSRPFVTPDTRALLERLGEAFQQRLREAGLPPFRYEISSVLRTAADQAALRDSNVNAATGASVHEFGTTVDIAYGGYAAPAELPAGLVPDDAPASVRPELEAVARITLERVAARKSRELEAMLGHVLREAQGRGDVLVTLERLQPVYHITVARTLADP